MVRFSKFLFLMLLVLGFASACEKDNLDADRAVPQSVIDKLTDMGFNPDGIRHMDDGYLIEGDILITQEFLNTEHTEHRVPTMEQYSTNNLVSTGGSRNITVYISAADNAGNSTATNGTDKARGGNKPGGGGGGSSDFPAEYGAALNDAIGRFNAENLTISFERVTDAAGANIVFTRLRKGDERQGILGSAGFPTSAGDPHNEIKMSGIILNYSGWDVKSIATVMAHEIGHCIGMRHTDYFDRSISCSQGGNEGASTVGANHIPGTPTGATLNAGSWMLSCTGGGDRPFNQDDKTALDYLY